MRDYTSGFSIIEGVAQTLGWMCRIEWNVGSSRFEHRSHCDRHIDTSVEANGYSITYDNFALKQQMRQAVGALINVAVAEGLVADNHRPSVGRPMNRALEKTMHATISIMRDVGVVPVTQQNAFVIWIQQRQLLKPPAIVFYDLSKQLH